MRRGDIRTALLAVLAEGPGHGYDVIKNLEEKSRGAWKPSPGSVYPTLQLLEDEGLVRSTEREAKRVYEITDDGRAEAARRIEEAGGTPWELVEQANAGSGDLHRSTGQLLGAAIDHATALGATTLYARPQGLDRVWVRFGFIPVPEVALPSALAGRPGAGLYAWRGGSALWTLREAAEG